MNKLTCLLAVLAVLAASILVAGCGGSSSQQTIATQAPPTQEFTPAPSKEEGFTGNCGRQLAAHPHSDCEFAENVRAAYYEDVGTGAGTVDAYNPETGSFYETHCKAAGKLHECKGSNATTVRFP